MSEVKMSDTKLSTILLLGLILLLVAWGFAIASWGYAAIIMPALFLTFASLVALVFVTRG
ncbi:hypothetical protein SAMN04488056_10449 [Cohaesibacter marisflavi]|uniref:Uncharacterized protein n=1 Tax=Cohaesibacter marisflavi TaxID=655353 RepID=A0A1I5FHT8_9HYPH|nr:hypothetical protein [Cohaesibacter marisflavi]SFO23368.1 hypothetical protein SAMN04488056_10449 [Cohaesibacter marisflavi]